MKKLLLILAIIILATCFTKEAQAQEIKSDYGYDMGSNLNVNPFLTLSYQAFSDGKFGPGAGILVSKKAYTFLSLRALAEVNSFIANGFDRFGRVMGGFQFDLGKVFYIFGDAGTAYNPSDRTSKYRITIDGGLGANIAFNKYVLLCAEIYVDRTQVEKNWSSNAAARLGLKIRPGITPSDKLNIRLLENQPKIIEELSLQEKANKEQIRQLTCAIDTANQTLLAANEVIKNMRKEIIKCEKEKEDCAGGGQVGSEFPDIAFRFGSSALTDFEYDVLMSIADIMALNSYSYVLYGYCSDNGEDDSNLRLAERRAEKVRDVLSMFGVSRSRLETQPIGKHVSYGDGQGVINQFVRIIRKQ